MTAGKGIVHFERKPDDLRDATYVSHGLQLWTALPFEHEETKPSFEHTPESAIPELRCGDGAVRVLVGRAFCEVSPVKTFASTIYCDVVLPANGRLELPALPGERAI